MSGLRFGCLLRMQLFVFVCTGEGLRRLWGSLFVLEIAGGGGGRNEILFVHEVEWVERDTEAFVNITCLWICLSVCSFIYLSSYLNAFSYLSAGVHVCIGVFCRVRMPYMYMYLSLRVFVPVCVFLLVCVCMYSPSKALFTSFSTQNTRPYHDTWLSFQSTEHRP